mmetsp:Transcript_12534/g.27046  ORF Transcript_12534/g.27046 Transcript_12534/m.27046 type:complete len:652 (-) Transcript_12534:405-2360(-)
MAASAVAVLGFPTHPSRVQGVTSSYRRPRSSEQKPLHEFAPNTLCGAATCSEQVHLILGAPGEMVISYVSADASTPSEATVWPTSDPSATRRITGEASAYSQLIYFEPDLLTPALGLPTTDEAALYAMQNTSAWAFDPFTGDKSSSYQERPAVDWGMGSYKNPQAVYTSPVIHTVRLSSLLPSTAYEYRVGGDGRNFSFSTPPVANPSSGSSELYPFSLGLTADIGQTEVSQATAAALYAHVNESVADGGKGLILLAGDLSYADGYYARWDSYGRMMEPTAARVPVMYTGGNHEFGTGEAWLSYNARYPMPYRSSRSLSNLWWSRDVGPVHLLALCSYAATAPGSLQYTWLEADLARVDRSLTPWLVVMMHVPWYNSNTGHVAEAELMRTHMEPLLYAHGVDIVLSGHVHAYERTLNVLNGCLNRCAPVYLNLGDGGNREGAYIPWREPVPSWSAFREASFGSGGLRILNSTHATYKWTRNACEGTDAPSHINFNKTCESIYWAAGLVDNAHFPTRTSDTAWIVRSPQRETAACEPYPSAPCTVQRLLPPPAAPPATLPPRSAVPLPAPSLPASSVGGFSRGALVGAAVGGAVSGALLAILVRAALPCRCRPCRRRPLASLSNTAVLTAMGGEVDVPPIEPAGLQVAEHSV